MIETIVVFILLFLPVFLIIAINKYKIVKMEEGLEKLYEYSKYLICQIQNVNEFKDYNNYTKFLEYFSKACDKEYLESSENIFCILHTDTKIIKAKNVDISSEHFNKFFDELRNTLKNKNLTVSFFNLNNASSYDTSFFWSLVNYRDFAFVKYITSTNLLLAFTFILTISLILFTTLIQKTLYILGIPFHLSFVNIIEFGQFILYDILTSLWFIIISSMFIMLIICWLFIEMIFLIYRFFNKKVKSKNLFLIKDIFLNYGFALVLFLLFFICIIPISLSLTSLAKMNFPDSIINYNRFLAMTGEYINYTGYPRVGNIQNKQSYIIPQEKQTRFCKV
jgi:hypothetical protein